MPASMPTYTYTWTVSQTFLLPPVVVLGYTCAPRQPLESPTLNQSPLTGGMWHDTSRGPAKVRGKYRLSLMERPSCPSPAKPLHFLSLLLGPGFLPTSPAHTWASCMKTPRFHVLFLFPQFLRKGRADTGFVKKCIFLIVWEKMHGFFSPSLNLEIYQSKQLWLIGNSDDSPVPWADGTRVSHSVAPGRGKIPLFGAFK